MSHFWTNAEQIFTTARQNSTEEGPFSILVGAGGAIHITSSEGWDLEALRLHHGAAAGYQVTRRAGRVRVEARSTEGSAVLEGPTGYRRPFGSRLECPGYQLVQPALKIAAG